MRREANVGGILGELFSLLVDAGRDLAIFTLVIGGVTVAGVLAGLTETTAGALSYDFGVDSSDTPASALFELASAAVSILGTYLLLARFLAVRGRLHTGDGRFWHYFGMVIVSTIAMVFGFFLLIVPGLIMLVRWSAASGFVIGAGEGVTGSLDASWRATKGHGWSIFFSAVILFVGIVVCAGVAGAISGAVNAQVGNVAAAFVEAAGSGVFAAFGIAVYCLVTDDAREISEVFA